MSGQRYTPEIQDEAVRQVTERSYSVKADLFESMSSLGSCTDKLMPPNTAPEGTLLSLAHPHSNCRYVPWNLAENR